MFANAAHCGPVPEQPNRRRDVDDQPFYCMKISSSGQKKECLARQEMTRYTGSLVSLRVGLSLVLFMMI